MKSSPVHRPLAWDHEGTSHLLFVVRDDGLGLARLQADRPLDRVEVITAATLLPADVDAALAQLADALARASMGLRLYVAAPEDSIWRACALANAHGLHRTQLQTECIGSAARPVFCVHCRTTTRAVHTNVAPCAGCGRSLFVRDHFSRNLGAYMGFQVDAEAPGELPEIVAAYR